MLDGKPVKVVPERIDAILRLDAVQAVDAAAGEVVLDFSAVPRIDEATLAAVEELAARAGRRSVKLILLGVSVDAYKVLKLVHLTRHLTVA